MTELSRRTFLSQNGTAWETTVNTTELDQLKLSLVHADEEEICEVFREVTGEEVMSPSPQRSSISNRLRPLLAVVVASSQAFY